MNSSMYLKLAFTNIKKNKNTFFPFGLSCGTMIAMFYMLLSISNQAAESTFYGGRTMSSILNLGIWVCGIFSAIVIFYTNGFLLKRRNKELGLYSVLGMEKRHIGKILIWEIILTGLISLFSGLLGGLLFSKMMFLVLLNLMNFGTSFEFGISINAVLLTLLIFSAIFLLIILFNNLYLRRLKPIELLQGSNVGDREPKAKWISAILGALCLSIGYYIAVTTENPIQAISKFFVAVLFVITGTYLLFISGSIVLLKGLKKNKKYYYHKTHFITVSGMMYRMKQNAVGLANICILSTAVMVVLSSTVSLYVGIDDVLCTIFPSDVAINYVYEPEEDEKNNLNFNYDTNLIADTVQNHALKYNVEVKDIQAYYSFNTDGIINEDNLIPGYYGLFDTVYLYALTLDDYRSIGINGESVAKLYNNEVHILSNNSAYSSMESIAIGKQKFKISSFSESMKLYDKLVNIMGEDTNTILMVVSDFDNLLALQETVNSLRNEEYGRSSIVYNYEFNLTGKLSDKEEFNITLRDALNEADIPHVASVDSIFTSRQDTLSIFGSLFFIGIFIGTLFLIATVLIIYYKQISEGFEDRDRFIIMQNVGMGKKEVKVVIKNQIMTIFYLPILLAVVHIIFAFDIIRKMLAVLNLTNVKLFAGCTFGTILIFVIIYGVVYKLTAKTYYKIVN
ncbi:MAG TPA: cell division protein FtsX [Clostridiales bacterium]|nr:cell division protein FtsX [Clostridiales bacterium]HCS10114.1 cell division protein FtsX [Clostridiales bacterium]